MKTFKDFQNDLDEAFKMKDGKVQFDYKSNDPEGISSRLGKTVGKLRKFEPYVTTTQTSTKHKVFSVYSSQGPNATTILKGLKKHTGEVDANEYEQFLKRTGLFITAKIMKKENIDVIVYPASSSNLIQDVVENIKDRSSGIKVFSNSFVKTIPSKIEIDRDDPKITPEMIKYLEKEMEKAKKAGYFAMKEIKQVRARKFIKNFLELAPDPRLRKSLEGRNIMVMDDVLASGNTLAEMCRQIEMYSPNKVIIVTLFKSAK